MPSPEPPATPAVSVKYPKRMGLTLVICAVLLAAALAIAFTIVHHERAEQQSELASQAAADSNAPPAVDVVEVTNSPSSLSMPLPGDTRGWFESTIYARVSGYVAKWFVDIGDKVHKGEVLATIDTPDLDAQLQSAHSEFAVAQSQVKVTEANVAFAKTTYERWSQSPKGVVSEQETEQKKAEYDAGLAQLKAAQSAVAADQSKVDQLRALEDYRQVTAPYDGVIIARQVDIGDLVTAGSTSSTTSLYRMAQADVIRIFVDAPQSVAADMVVGLAAVAITDENPPRKFAGKIARTSRAVDPVARTLKVEVDVSNPDLALLPGTYLTVDFELKQKALIEVPASALVFRSAGPQVAVVDSDGKINFRDVTIARDEGEVVELGSGLSPGDRVALNVSSQIADGDRVTANSLDHPASTASSDH